MSKFKVGDRVRVKCTGKIGTITRVDDWRTYPYKIAEDQGNEPFGENELEQVETRREFIVIHRDGNVITAEHRVNREIIKSAKATCNPSDTFDFDTGAKLAFDRLMWREEPKPESEPPKYYTGKVVAIENDKPKYGSCASRRIGVRFNFIDGYCKLFSEMFDMHQPERIKSFQHLCNRYYGTDWIEIKE